MRRQFYRLRGEDNIGEEFMQLSDELNILDEVVDLYSRLIVKAQSVGVDEANIMGFLSDPTYNSGTEDMTRMNLKRSFIERLYGEMDYDKVMNLVRQKAQELIGKLDGELEDKERAELQRKLEACNRLDTKIAIERNKKVVVR